MIRGKKKQLIYEARLKEINTYYLAKWQPEDMIRLYKYWEDVNMGHTEDFYVGYLDRTRRNRPE